MGSTLLKITRYLFSKSFINDLHSFFVYIFLPKGEKKIVYIIPGTGVSGGIAVVVQHANRLIKRGYPVILVTADNSTQIDWIKCNAPIFPYNDTKLKYIYKDADLLIATAWSTVEFLERIPSKRRLYFIQSDERRFFKKEERDWIKKVEKTYKGDYEYFTMAKWIQKWLKEEFHKDAYYVPNGIDLNEFHKTSSIKPSRKPFRILLEGPISLWFKGMDDAYAAVEGLDCEIWIVSGNGKPPASWEIDRFFEAVPFKKMAPIYSSCDFLLKMSYVESFSYPPLEAMACGCIPIVTRFTGYNEYIEANKNALVIDIGDIQGARKAILRLIESSKLRDKLLMNGVQTVTEWSWNNSIDRLEDVIKKKSIKISYTQKNSYSYKKESNITPHT